MSYQCKLIICQHSWPLTKACRLHASSLCLMLSSAGMGLELEVFTLVKVRRGCAACMEGHAAAEFRWYNPLSSKPPLPTTPDAMSAVAGWQNEPGSMLLPGNVFCCSLVLLVLVRGAEALNGCPKRRLLRSACNWSTSWSLCLNPRGGSSARPGWTPVSLCCGCVNGGPVTRGEGEVSTWPIRVGNIGCPGSAWFWVRIVENQGADTCHTRCPGVSHLQGMGQTREKEEAVEKQVLGSFPTCRSCTIRSDPCIGFCIVLWLGGNMLKNWSFSLIGLLLWALPSMPCKENEEPICRSDSQ